MYESKWLKEKGKWYYFDSYGTMVTGREKINNKWYHFDSNGVMKQDGKKIIIGIIIIKMVQDFLLNG